MRWVGHVYRVEERTGDVHTVLAGRWERDHLEDLGVYGRIIFIIFSLQKVGGGHGLD
jgi:hypothetical protein